MSIIEPLLRDRVAIAFAKNESDQRDANPAPVGVAIWASVSEEVDAKINEQVKAGVFPTRLAQDEWTSGETLWLLDILAPNRKAASAVISAQTAFALPRVPRGSRTVASSPDVQA